MTTDTKKKKLGMVTFICKCVFFSFHNMLIDIQVLIRTQHIHTHTHTRIVMYVIIKNLTNDIISKYIYISICSFNNLTVQHCLQHYSAIYM